MSIPSFHVTLDRGLYFKKYAINPKFPPPPHIKKPSTLQVVWKKIVAFVKKIWRALFVWKTGSNFKLTKRQLKLIKQARKERKYVYHRPEPLLATRKEHVPIAQVSLHQKLSPPKYPKDQTLVDLCTFLEEFSHILIVDCIGKTGITPKLPEWKEAVTERLDQIKPIVSAVDGLIQAASPLLQKLDLFNDPEIFVLVQQLFAIILKPHGEGPEAKVVIEKQLVCRMQDLMESGEIDSAQFETIMALIPSAMNWVFNPNNSLFKTPHPKILHTFLLDAFAFFKSLAAFVKESEFDEMIEKMQDHIEQTFESGVLTLIGENTVPLTNIVSSRIAELVANAPFYEIFKELLVEVSNHLDSWIKAQQHRSAHYETVQNSGHDAGERGTELEPIEKHREAKDYNKLVEEDGGEEAFLENQFHIRFAETPDCHPEIQKMIQAQSERLKALVQDGYIEKIIDLCLPRIFPEVNVELPDGTQIKVHGLLRLIEQIRYPEEFQQVFQLSQEFKRRVFEGGEFKDPENFERYLSAIQKIVLTGLIAKKVREMIKQGLKTLIDKLCSKPFLDEAVGEVVLPSLIKSILLGWIKITLLEATQEFAPLFHSIIENGCGRNPLNIHHELLDRLFTKMKSQLIDFQLAEAGITFDVFKKIANPLISEVLNHLMVKLKNDDPQKQITATEVVAAIRKYLDPDKAPLINTYGDIAIKSLTEIGGLSLGAARSKIRKTITAKASIGLHELGSSYHFLISNLVLVGREKYLNPETLASLIYPRERPDDVQRQRESEIRRHLSANLGRLSALVHDILYRSIQGTFIIGGILKKFTPETPTINKTLTTIFHDLFKRPIPNKNLVFKIMQVVEKGLKMADLNLRKRSAIHQRVNSLSSSD